MMERPDPERVTPSAPNDQARALRDAEARVADLARRLADEEIYSAKLAHQLAEVGRSRLWRGAQWVRRLVGRVPLVADLSRPEHPPATPTGPEMSQIFGAIYHTNAWGSEVSRSGTGSDLEQTAVVRELLPVLTRELAVQSMLDLPCGDFHWMRTLDLDLQYIGADVVPDLIAGNAARDGNERRRFTVLDIATQVPPRVDLIFCRDLLVHFSLRDAQQAIANFKRSGSVYLLTTTFRDRRTNPDISTGQWRPINLELPPFNFPPPLRLIDERCTEGGTEWADKSLGLWRLADL